MKRSWVLWIIAVIITLSSAIYQRMTGPTYPLRGETNRGDYTLHYKFFRSHGGETDQIVSLTVPGENFSGVLSFKRYKTNDSWTEVEMRRRDNNELYAYLPGQPPAGKLMYKITLTDGNNSYTLPDSGPVIIRFKGEVPAVILIPHIIFMFAAMLVSTKAGLEAIFRKKSLKELTYWSAGLLFIGGMILGPLVQLYAFDALWTGFPFGYDLTDNKTLIAMIGWFFALIAVRKGKNPERWILLASIVQLAIYLIPHSVLGSELDYSKIPDTTPR